MKREQIIIETKRETLRTVHRGSEDLPTHDQIIEVAAEVALDLAGFSDDEPANSPRPVENSPLNAQKKPGFGPEQTR